MPSTMPAGSVINLPDLTFDNAFLRALPADRERNGTSRDVFNAAYSYIVPTPVAAPRLLSWATDAAALLGLGGLENPADVDLAAHVFTGNHLLPGMTPYATCYGGHQFGNWAGQLGDGRAIMLGEALGPDGQRWEIQLKGAGKTPYSRWADGRAVLRSSIREYVCSEAMHHLGVPTTRALCLVGTGEGVERDMFYDGRSRTEPGAIVTRLAPSFIRFGHLEIHAVRGDNALLQALLDHVITQHFPRLGQPSEEVYLAWFEEVCRRTAVMMAHWMRVGFVHGVMNTDNLSVLGLTIDYGPYGWLDNFDTNFTPNTTDRGGRYSFGNQPQIGAWNLACLAQALMPLVNDADALHIGLAAYKQTFESTHFHFMRDKLGLPQGGEEQDGMDLVEKLFALFDQVETDMAIFFRSLSALTHAPADAALQQLAPAFYQAPTESTQRDLHAWVSDWQARIAASPEDPAARVTRMNHANPWLIPRNWIVQQVINAAEEGDLAPLEQLMSAIRAPYTAQPDRADWAGRRPNWARHAAGCSALSCSS